MEKTIRDASGLSTESEQRQISTLLYYLGKDADDILVLTNITEDEHKRYKDVMAKFDGHFKIHCNLILEPAKFNKRV